MRIWPVFGLICFAATITSQDHKEYPSRREIDLNTISADVEADRVASYQDTMIADQIESYVQDKLDEKLEDLIGEVKKKFFKQAKLRIQAKLWKVTSRVLTKIGKKTGIKLLARLGLKAGKKAAIKIGTAIAAKLGTTLSTSASTGPATPIVAAVQLAFDVLSFVLDFGDLGGYQKMGTVAEYIKMKKGIDKELEKELTAEGGDFPSIVGPLDRLDDIQYETLVNATIDEIMDLNNDNPINARLRSKLASDVSNNELTRENVDEKVDMYAKLVESDDVLDMACTKANGKVVVTRSGDRGCSYKDKATCDSSYSWPMAEDSDEIYGEYKSNLYGGACVTESYALRSICEGNHLPYDSETGICKINETYCKMKGADYAYSEEVNGYDCKITFSQSFAENIFGTTIVRGMRQIFDFSQYESCKVNETDDGYFCRRIFCAEGEEQFANGGICYPKCDQGYHPFGCCVCSPDCPEGWTDDGITCRRAGTCDEGKEHDGALCYDPCPSGYDGVGPGCWKPCPEGYMAVGALCSKGAKST